MRTRKGNIYGEEQLQILNEELEKREYEENKVSDDLVQAHLDLVRMQVKKTGKLQKQLLRNLLKTQRFEITNSRENGRDPLLVFPEEIWTMILNNVTDEKDFANCKKSCPLFHRILANTSGQYMFGLVFPHFLKYFSDTDVYNCRLVCTKWCQDVDTIFENFYAVKDSGKTNLKPIKEMGRRNGKPEEFNFEYTLTATGHQEYNLNNKLQDLASHSRNPFIGRSVTIRAMPPADQDNMPSFEVAFSHFISNFGEHIHHFSLTSFVNSFSYYSFESAAQFYSFCQEILTQFKNMKSLSLEADIRPEDNKPKRKMREKPLPNHDFLESLTIRMGNTSPFIFHFKYNVFTKYLKSQHSTAGRKE